MKKQEDIRERTKQFALRLIISRATKHDSFFLANSYFFLSFRQARNR
jgi:hypothetical protein